MIVEQAESEGLATPVRIRVTASRGETRYVQIPGIPVEFEFNCQSGYHEPEVIPSPSIHGPGRVAIFNTAELLGRLSASSEIDASADPVTIPVPWGRNVSIEDIGDAIDVCRQENRAIRFDLGKEQHYG